MNQHISLNDKERSNITLGQFYSTIAVVYYSHNAGCSLSRSTDTLKILGIRTPSITLCRYVITHLCVFPVTVQCDYADLDATWEAQQDQTTQTEVGPLVFTPLARMFLIPLHDIIMLDEDLVRTRATYLEAKALSCLGQKRVTHVRRWCGFPLQLCC